MKRWIASLVVVGVVGQVMPVWAQSSPFGSYYEATLPTVDHPLMVTLTESALVRTVPDTKQSYREVLLSGTMVTVIGVVNEFYQIQSPQAGYILRFTTESHPPSVEPPSPSTTALSPIPFPSTTALSPETETEYAHPALGLAGIIMAVTGIVMVAPHGEEYHIVGHTYCVSYDYHNVDSGGCGNDPDVRKVGAALLGAGALMTYLGLRSRTVAVHPSRHGVSATATLKWGK